MPQAGVQVASLDPRDAFRLAFETRPDLFGGGVRVADVSGAMPVGGPGTFPLGAMPSGIPTLPDGSPDWAAFEQQLNAAAGAPPPSIGQMAITGGLAAPDVTQYSPVPLGVDQITEVDPTASAAMQDLQALSRRLDINNAARRIGNSVLERTSALPDYVLRTPEEGARRAEDRAQGRRVRNWYVSDEAQAIFQENEDLLQVAARDPLAFYQQYSGETVTPDAAAAEVPAQPTAPMTEAPAQPTAPMTEAPAQPMAGLSMAQESPDVALRNIATQTGGDLSQFTLRNPAGVLQMADNAYRILQTQENLLAYYRQIGDITGVIDTQNKILVARQAIADLSGQVALAGVQLDNYGPLQLYYEQAYPRGEVEVRPYTDGTVEVFVDGESLNRFTKPELFERLAKSFNEEYIRGQAALAQALAENRKAQFEQEIETAGAIALERVQQEGRLNLELFKAELERQNTGVSYSDLRELSSGVVMGVETGGGETRIVYFTPGVERTPEGDERTVYNKSYSPEM